MICEIGIIDKEDERGVGELQRISVHVTKTKSVGF
jgi:hypothetical protein